MKIKHFQGYGSVDAVKVSRTIVDDSIVKLVIRVSGNHEWGLERDDKYDVFNWLVKRFDKTIKSDSQIIKMDINDFYEGEVENCIYTIYCKVD